jgi:hypothetical protein
VKYPKVIDEAATLAASQTNSLARFGDGELSIALGGDCVSQRRDPKLAAELREILQNKSPELLVGIPNVESKTKPAWAKYGGDRYTALYGAGTFGSSFITRPDSAPWIDTPEYWRQLSGLWRGRVVVLVAGTERSLRPEQLVGANDIRRVGTPRRDAYAEIDRIEAEIGIPPASSTVLMCVGPTATVLAARLAKKGVHAVDLGHVGMFMRHAGAYRYTRDDFITPEYRAQLARLHKKRSWGADGAKHAQMAIDFYRELGAATLLDYGCGEGRLKLALSAIEQPIRVQEYDPGIDGKEGLPKPCDLVVSTDVMEHVEPDKLEAVEDHLYRISGMGALLVIATRAANAVLPDGRNAHLIIQPAAWWIDRIRAKGWQISNVQIREGKDVTLWLRK